MGELPLGTQARLLRVLEYGEFIKVGSSKVQKAQVRVVAATNVDLLSAIQKGKFREDLYYRLNTIPLRIPPLRERGTDVSFLFRKFAADFTDRYHVKPIQLTEEAQQSLLAYRFPGNIRQLKNLVEQLSALEITRQISKETLHQYLPPLPSKLPALYQGGGASEDLQERELLYKILFEMKRDVTELKSLVFELLSSDAPRKQLIQEHAMLFQSMDASTAVSVKALPQSTLTPVDDPKVEENLSIEDKEQELIGKALKKHHNNRKEAAKNLGISERTLYRKIKQYDLD